MNSEDSLRKALIEGNCVLFLGSGASRSCTFQDGSLLPLGNELAEMTYQHFYPHEVYEGETLQQVCSFISSSYGSGALHKYYSELFDNIIPSQGLKDLSKIKWHNIYTTNIDRAIETAYELEHEKAQELKVIVGPFDIGSSDRNTQVSLHKIHGCCSRPDVQLVFSLGEYADSKEQHLRLFKKLGSDLAEKVIIFIGYSMVDSDFQQLWTSICKYFNNSTTMPNRYYYVSPNIKKPLAQYLEQQNFTTFDKNLEEFARYLLFLTKGELKTLEAFYSDHIVTTGLFDSPDLSIKDKYELSLDYKFPLIETNKYHKRKQDFYKGMEPSWGDIKHELDGRRDILEKLLEEFSIWMKKPYLDCWVITGRSGDGKSTILKRFAVELAILLGETVLFADSRAKIDPERIVKLAKTTSQPLIIFIDNIGDRIKKANRLFAFLKDKNIKCLVIGASRTSDWTTICQDSIVIKHKVYNLNEKLSDQEIDNILKKLEVNDSLGALKELTYDARKRLFKTVADRILLVALYQIITNQNFETRIAHEYINIKSEEAKKAYLLVCMVTQYRYRLPQSLLWRIMNIKADEMNDLIYKYTEGIIYFDETRDNYDILLRARHPVIAEVIIKEFCRDNVAKFNSIETIIKKVIPSNPLEISLVKKLYHHSTIKSLFSSLIEGRNCYDMLAEEIPEDAFLLQQKALFLCDFNEYDEAKQVINQALSLYPSSHILLNSKGTIYLKESLMEYDRAKSEYLRDQGKKILLDSNKWNRFNSSYNLHSLISHLISWQQKFGPNGQDLLIEIQSLLETAVKIYPNESNFIVQEGRLQNLLSNTPEAKKYFERAKNLNPYNMSARFLLAKILVSENNLPDAFDIVYEGCKLKQDEVLLNRLRFEIMHKLHTEYREMIKEYKEYFNIVKDDWFARICCAAYQYINEDDECTDLFTEFKYNPYLSAKDKFGIVWSIDNHLGIDKFHENSRVVTQVPRGYLLKSERFDTRTYIYCPERNIEYSEENNRYQCIVRFNYLGPRAFKAKTIE